MFGQSSVVAVFLVLGACLRGVGARPGYLIVLVAWLVGCVTQPGPGAPERTEVVRAAHPVSVEAAPAGHPAAGDLPEQLLHGCAACIAAACRIEVGACETDGACRAGLIEHNRCARVQGDHFGMCFEGLAMAAAADSARTLLTSVAHCMRTECLGCGIEGSARSSPDDS